VKGENVENRIQSSSAKSSPLAFRKRQNLGDQVIAAVVGAARRVFHTTRLRTIIVGVSLPTQVVATELYGEGKPVSLIDLRREPKSEIEAAPFVMVVHQATCDEDVLTRAGAQTARCVVAATTEDDRNLSLCRTALERFRVPVVIARLRLMDGITSWARVNDAGMARLSWRDLIQALVPDQVLSPVLSRLASTDDREQIAEIEVRTPLHVGRKIADLPFDDCEVLGLARNGNSVADLGSIDLRMNDVLTLVGTRAALARVRESMASL
jgi:Trk K+ transport system NAD-binding subunit